MISGLYPVDNFGIHRACSKCHRPLLDTLQVYVHADPLNLQVTPDVFHPKCAAVSQLFDLWGVIQGSGIADFPGRLFHKRDPYDFFVIVRDHLRVRFGLEEFEAEVIIKDWSAMQ